MASLPWAIIGLGILFRLAHYLHNPSLWVDEAALSLNIVSRPFNELVGSLDYLTAAPVGFLAAVKLSVELLGNNEQALRLVPLLAGVGALFLLYATAKRCLTAGAVPIALLLFAASTPLVRFSNHVKQYSSDVLIALLLFLVAHYVWQRDFNNKWLVLYAILGAVVIWVSFTSVFVLAGAGATLGLVLLSRREWSKLAGLTVISLVWLTSFSLSFQAPGVSELATNEGFKEQLESSSDFVPLPPFSERDIRWFSESLFDLFRTPVGLPLTGIGALAFLAGCIALARTNKYLLVLVLSPILVTAVVSAAQLYPFADRWLLFLVPFVILLVAEGAVFMAVNTRRASPAIGVALIGLLLLHPLGSEAFRLIEPRGSEEVRPVLQYIQTNRSSQDQLYVYYGATKAFLYYADRFEMEEGDYVIGTHSEDPMTYMPDLDVFASQIDQFQGYDRVWFLFSNAQATYVPGGAGRGVDDQQFFLHHLDNVGVRKDQYRVNNAVAYLYDLNPGNDLANTSPPAAVR